LKYRIYTFGCQMNEHDSEIMAGMLDGMGCNEAESDEDADVILFNTCCVREKPEFKLYSKIGNLKSLKKRKPELVIGVCGCMAQQEGVRNTILHKYSHVDLVFGTHNMHRLPELLEKVRATGERLFEVWESEGEVVEGLPVLRADPLKAWLTIMYGCNNFCAYCIVPYVRGRERSRGPEGIEKEVIELGQKGYKEVTLLGQNVNSYGKDLDSGVDFSDLLMRLDALCAVSRIRFVTSHPKDCPSKLIDTIASCKTVCEHIHLPLQAGSNNILDRMNRKYTRERYLDLISDIKSKIPNVSITTDLIVGFPGETEDDFEETLDMVRQVRYDSAFTFAYSSRPGTRAASFKDQVQSDVKKDRLQRLIEVQNAISAEKNQELIGKALEVLVEGKSKTNPHTLSGRTRTNKIVVFPGSLDDLYGKLVQVRINEAGAWTLEGEVEQNV
jgi:tRNA-2-methylthio-N6-dimethylallyladenosine synthase